MRTFGFHLEKEKGDKIKETGRQGEAEETWGRIEGQRLSEEGREIEEREKGKQLAVGTSWK